MNGEKIGKSSGNVAYLSDLTNRGLSPMALRYWFLTAHYRSPANFSWEALEGAAAAHRRLSRIYRELNVGDPISHIKADPKFMSEFLEHMANDLDTPRALATLWDLVRNQDVAPEVTRASITEADKILGLQLGAAMYKAIHIEDLPKEIQSLLKEREKTRSERDFSKSDELRDQLKEKGYEVLDSPEGQKISKL